MASMLYSEGIGFDSVAVLRLYIRCKTTPSLPTFLPFPFVQVLGPQPFLKSTKDLRRQTVFGVNCASVITFSGWVWHYFKNTKS